MTIFILFQPPTSQVSSADLGLPFSPSLVKCFTPPSMTMPSPIPQQIFEQHMTNPLHVNTSSSGNGAHTTVCELYLFIYRVQKMHSHKTFY